MAATNIAYNDAHQPARNTISIHAYKPAYIILYIGAYQYSHNKPYTQAPISLTVLQSI